MKRILSLLITIVALFAVPLLAYLQGASITRAQVQAQGWACGMPILALFFWALCLSGGLSAVALLLGVLAYRQVAPPRPKRRLLELVVVALPLLLASLGLLAFVFL